MDKNDEILDSCKRLAEMSLILLNHCIDGLGDALSIGEGAKLHDVVEKIREFHEGVEAAKKLMGGEGH